MTRNTRGTAGLPTAYPQHHRPGQGKGSGYDARMAAADALTRRLDRALSAAIMEAPPEIATTGELAALLARLDPETPLTLQETVQVQGNLLDWQAPGGDWVRSVVADHGVMIGPDDPPLVDDSGQEHAVILPALTLGLRWLPAAQTPEPGMQTPVHACDRIVSARSSADGLTAAADAVDGIARMLTGDEGPATGLPDGSTAPGQITEAAGQLRALAEQLRDLAPLADDEEYADPR